MKVNLKTIASVAFLSVVSSASATYTQVDFEDLSFTSGLYENGANLSGSFNSEGASFSNYYNGWWSGWSYSSVVDTATAGWLNEFAAYSADGKGVNSSSNYGVAYSGATISFDEETSVLGGYFTNTTYAALSMLNGDSYAKQFGGATGEDPDWFELTITGLDDDGVETGAITVSLADYTAPTGADELVDDWTWVNLLPLGEVKQITLSFESSDVGDWGMNTPAYVALDDLYYETYDNMVPEPASLVLLASGCLMMASRRRRAKSAV